MAGGWFQFLLFNGQRVLSDDGDENVFFSSWVSVCCFLAFSLYCLFGFGVKRNCSLLIWGSKNALIWVKPAPDNATVCRIDAKLKFTKRNRNREKRTHWSCTASRSTEVWVIFSKSNWRDRVTSPIEKEKKYRQTNCESIHWDKVNRQMHSNMIELKMAQNVLRLSKRDFFCFVLNFETNGLWLGLCKMNHFPFASFSIPKHLIAGP